MKQQKQVMHPPYTPYNKPIYLGFLLKYIIGVSTVSGRDAGMGFSTAGRAA